MVRSTRFSSTDGTYREHSTDDRGVEVREHRRWMSPGRVFGALVGLVTSGGKKVPLLCLRLAAKTTGERDGDCSQ